MKLILQHLKPHKLLVFFTITFVAVSSLLNLVLPDLNATIINEGVMAGNLPVIYKYGLIMIGMALLEGACTLIGSYCSSKLGANLGRDLRRTIFAKVQTFSQADVDEFGAATLITRNTNDVNSLQMTTQMALRQILTVPISLIGGVIMALRQDLTLSLILLFVVPLIALTVFFITRTTHPMFKKIQKQVDKLNQVLREQLSGVRVIRAFVRTKYEEDRYKQANREMYEISTRAHRIMTIMFPMMFLIMDGASLVAYYFGAIRIDSGYMPVGNLTAFISYMMQILMTVHMCSMMFNMIPRAMTSAERISLIVNKEPSITDKAVEYDANGKPLQIGAFQSLEFRDVSFAYPDTSKPVINHVSFTALPGETTAIIGSTGSGKSSLVNLIPRFYDVTEGQILLNGHDIRHYMQDDLRRVIGMVPQKSFLFEGTVASNLRYGKNDATEDEMWHALEVAQGKDFVSERPGQLESDISQGGTNVSGGQRQRLSIARAVVRHPDIYIFDDSFSALDFKTDAALRMALQKETTEAVVFIVAQRVTTVMGADRIIVLDEGKVVGIGKHKELMQTCPVYKEIILSQLSEEEVA